MNLMLEAFILLAAGVVAVPIASRLGLGSVLGYLLAGTLIGPFALGFIYDAEHIMHFAEFGVVIMLFLIGLELRPALLWRMRTTILGLGGLQVILTAAAITGIAAAFDQPLQIAFAIGLILSLSSTALALQILGEKGLMKTEGGKSAFAVLLFQDIAVIPIIALLPLLAGGVAFDPDGVKANSLISQFPAWQRTVIVLCTMISIIVAGRYLTRPVFRFIAESRLREIFTATALLMVIGISLLMEMVGLSPALGAFIAGVVLADNEYRHELQANIDPFKALLLGLFFISVGASIDFNLLMAHPLALGGIVLGLVALKFAILWALGRVFGISVADRYWFSFGLAQGGEFGFVLLTFSLSNHILDTATVDMLTAAIALSMVLTPLLILLNEKFIQPKQETREDIADDMPIEMQDNPVIIAGFGRFGQIVGRVLLANKIPVTVLDNSGSQVERLRQYGFKVYYGDASRADLLQAAGAEHARLLIVAVDSRDKIRKVIKTAQRHYPNLKIFSRAYDVIHYQELRAMNVDHIEREVFHGSLHVGELALRSLGMGAYQAHRSALKFAKHDQETMERLRDVKRDSTKYISEARRAHEQVLMILQSEQEKENAPAEKAWAVSAPDPGEGDRDF